jgi:oxygen-independent coproporphyrinogen-3 oxidase
MHTEELIKKYNVPVPRYTSYPTVPLWDSVDLKSSEWLEAVNKCFDETNQHNGISLYIHLPFCEALCTYCACNKQITRDHTVEDPYINSVLKEWDIYVKQFKSRPILRELHLGGGTPTFFSPENLEFLISNILKTVDLHSEYEFSFEGHPNNTTYEHLKTLYDLGFRRVSYGVQDLDEKVQLVINRIQPYENVKRATLEAREIGYTSVNFDLVYGLPLQTTKSIEMTIDQITELMPDRIAFYSYAHVPWKKTGQRKFSEKDLPSDAEKRALYQLGKEKLLKLGLKDVGMDHFALSEDSLFKAFENKKLNRNFMGYTTSQSELLIGLGTSSISDAKYAYAQNLKETSLFEAQIATGDLAVFKGHKQTEEDRILRKAILDIACHAELKLTAELKAHLPENAMSVWQEMEKEGIIELTEQELKLTPELGKMFLRNVCAVADKRMYLKEQHGEKTMFSKSI